MMINDENESPYLENNRYTYCTDPTGVDVNSEEFKESNRMHGRYNIFN